MRRTVAPFRWSSPPDKMDNGDRAYLVRRWKDELRAAERAESGVAMDRHHRLASDYARRIAALDAAQANDAPRTRQRDEAH